MISINRFEKIRQYFHCNDNSVYLSKSDQNFDKLLKVQPVIDTVLVKCNSVPQEEMQLVDEQVIPTESRCGVKRYMAKKPTWGIKVWTRCRISGTGYDFEICTGQAPNTQDKVPGIMIRDKVVHSLTKKLPYHQNFKLYFDYKKYNFFSSVTLMKFLKENLSCSYIMRRSNERM